MRMEIYTGKFSNLIFSKLLPGYSHFEGSKDEIKNQKAYNETYSIFFIEKGINNYNAHMQQ